MNKINSALPARCLPTPLRRLPALLPRIHISNHTDGFLATPSQECIAKGQPLTGPATNEDYEEGESEAAIERAAERRQALNSQLESLKATAVNVQEIKATVEKKKAMLEAPENAWPLPPDVATWETADEAALKAETKELLAHAALVSHKPRAC